MDVYTYSFKLFKPKIIIKLWKGEIMKKLIKISSILMTVILISFNCSSQNPNQYGSLSETNLRLKEDKVLGTISVLCLFVKIFF